MNISFNIIQERKKGINYILGLSFVFIFIPIFISKNISWDIMKWVTLGAILVFVLTSIYDKNSRRVIGELTFNSDSVKLEIKGIIRTILKSEIMG